MPKRAVKTTHIQVRLAPEQKAHIRGLSGGNMSEYLLSLVPGLPEATDTPEDLTAIKDPVARDMLRNWNPVTSLR
jgi:hypothetical protein